MARAHYLVAVPTAIVLSVAPVAELVMGLWLLIAAEIAVCLMLAQEWRMQRHAVVAANDNEAPRPAVRRLSLPLRSRRPVLHAGYRWCRLACQRVAPRRRQVSS